MNPELESLMQRYLDGSISADEMARLNCFLDESAEARREFVELLNLDSAVAASAAGWERPEKAGTWRQEDSNSVVLPSSLPRGRAAKPSFMRSWTWAAAACLALMLSAWWWQGSQRVFATVVNDAGAEELSNGTKLRGEMRSLRGGNVELVTALGARLVIEAPAEFRFESAQRLRLMKGRLSAEVPPAAKGFTVITPSGDAVDLEYAVWRRCASERRGGDSCVSGRGDCQGVWQCVQPKPAWR